MLNGKKIAVVLPAYNAEKTLPTTVAELPGVDFRILVDDGSADQTVARARELGLDVYVHDRNYGYGGTSRPAIERRWPAEPTL
jgi:glycosyltransferase involved in cell wall biosynthesis